MRGDLAVQPQGVCLIGLFLGVTGTRQGTLGKLVRLLQAAGQEIRLTQMGGPERIRAHKRVAVRSTACSRSGWASARRPDSVYA